MGRNSKSGEKSCSPTQHDRSLRPSVLSDEEPRVEGVIQYLLGERCPRNSTQRRGVGLRVYRTTMYT